MGQQWIQQKIKITLCIKKIVKPLSNLINPTTLGAQVPQVPKVPQVSQVTVMAQVHHVPHHPTTRSAKLTQSDKKLGPNVQLFLRRVRHKYFYCLEFD